MRLSVLRQRVTVEKRPFVFEEAVIRKGPTKRLVRVDEQVRREQLSVDSSVDLAGETVPIEVPER